MQIQNLALGIQILRNRDKNKSEDEHEFIGTGALADLVIAVRNSKKKTISHDSLACELVASEFAVFLTAGLRVVQKLPEGYFYSGVFLSFLSLSLCSNTMFAIRNVRRLRARFSIPAVASRGCTRTSVPVDNVVNRPADEQIRVGCAG